jgi:uncharacterized protein YkwD
LLARCRTTVIICVVRPVFLIVSCLTLGAVAFALWPRDSTQPADACGATEGKPSAIGLAAAGQTTLCLINRERTRRGLLQLRENALLSAASLEHSQDMVWRRYFEHITPDGRTVGDRLRAIGYARGVSASAGENIAYGFRAESTPGSIVRAWMASPGHREDILRAAFTEIGIGVETGAPELPEQKQSDSATYTTDFGGVLDPSLPNG